MSSSELAKRLRKGERWKLADEPSQPEGMGSEVPQPKPEAVGEECWFAHLDALVDIWEDGNYNAPEDRCYVPGALKDTMLRAKAAIAANRTALTHPSTPKTAGPREGEPLTDGELTKIIWQLAPSAKAEAAMIRHVGQYEIAEPTYFYRRLADKIVAARAPETASARSSGEVTPLSPDAGFPFPVPRA